MSEAALTVTKAESVQVPAIVHFPFLELSAILVGGKKLDLWLALSMLPR